MARMMKKEMSNLLFVLPVVAIVALILIFPLFYGGYLSFFKSISRGTARNFIGFKNYVDTLNNAGFYRSLIRTCIYTAASVFHKDSFRH